MEGETYLTINGVTLKCIGYYGYNNHYYVTIFNDENGAYLGQLVDAKITESKFEEKVKNFIKENSFAV